MKTLLIAGLMIVLASCSKEEIAKDAVISAMTTGSWKVVKFMADTTSYTSQFDGYEFVFKTDGSVDAIKQSNVEKTGSWAADANEKTISSQFSSGSSTLTLLNGTWKISNNSWTFVEAGRSEGAVYRTIRLQRF